MFDPIRGSIWKANVNFFIGSLFLGSFALWAAIVIIQTAWGTNPIAKAFAATIYAETHLPD